ncbi:polypeptide N-acetylgalactosaminyltransferase 3-like [Haliotis rubra]|uniref:polypeptide N-acetylgalactosaminyltransferase 3-like n=1 Tax=Haliotis rubra TaxID=36100 RepID=UPI001EE611E8|nr:polypeptide N-acetylgalactosaminyltransferase 3-like [Haliotis rubra]
MACKSSLKVKILLGLAIVVHIINIVVIYKLGLITRVAKTGQRGLNLLERNTSYQDFDKIREDVFPKNLFTEVSRFFINVTKSNQLPVDRPIPDTRPYECRKVNISGAALPSVSVIIPMHNEPWSTLLRTIHTVINNSPPHLLHEVIIIDDKSDLPFLGKPMTLYLRRFPKVSLIRSAQRLGTMKSRNLGANIAQGEVLVYLDSHTEVNIGWLEPIVWEIYKNRQTVIQPAIDTIDAMTLEYRKYMENMRGEFKWSLAFTFAPIPPRALLGRTSTDPIITPAIVGCCFAVDRKYYLDLGGLDEGMKTWGAEDVEFSLRVWMCGGNMKILECSRVGHIFKSGHPFAVSYDDLLHNEQRIAELWLGEHKQIFYAVHEGRVSHSADIGDLSTIRQTQRNLNCNRFTWYLENVLPELEVPPLSSVKFGKAENLASSLCIGIDNTSPNSFHLIPCWGYGSTNIALTQNGFLKVKDKCMGSENRYIVMKPCSIDDVSQQWTFTTNHQLMWHDGKSCMMHVSDPDPATGHRQTIMLMPCEVKKDHVKFTQWTFTYSLSFPHNM